MPPHTVTYMGRVWNILPERIPHAESSEVRNVNDQVHVIIRGAEFNMVVMFMTSRTEIWLEEEGSKIEPVDAITAAAILSTILEAADEPDPDVPQSIIDYINTL